MLQSQFLGILYALMASASWGGGDFVGGYSVRKINQFQVLFISASCSLLFMLVLAFLRAESVPSLRNTLIATLAGAAGAAGLTMLYKGLSVGPAALVSSVAGVIGALIPMLAGIFVEGFPGSMQISGFFLALSGIWMVTRYSQPSSGDGNGSLRLAILAGLGFGCFLALVARLDGEQIFAPLVIAKLSSVLLAVLIIRGRGESIPRLTRSPAAVGSGILDAGGNMFYLLATQTTRLDVAAVLSSLYPAGTVLLSSLILHEKVSSKQWLGVSACIVAIMLITM